MQGVGGKVVKLTDLSNLESNHSGKKLDIVLDIPQLINWCHLTSSSYKDS